MEAVPRLPMISFPGRTSTDVSDLGEQLRKYIRNHYHEDPESYSNEIYELECLRRSATNASTDFIGCSTLKKYYCQLHFLTSRFPFNESGVKVSFTWFSAFDQNCSNSGDVSYEMDSILYNIAALHTALGALDARTTSDGMKISCTHFQCASWAFQVLSQNTKGESELNPLLMNFMMNLALSQAQECILEKSMTDNRKPNIIAKVAMQVVDYLKLTLKNLDSFKKSNGFAVELVGSKLIKIWQRHCEFKIAYYYAVTYFHQGLQSEEQQKMGERLAYYQGAVEKLEETAKLSKNLEKAKAISETLSFANDVIRGKLTAGQKENEFVYHEKVPSLASLPEVKGASLVKGISFSFTDPEVAGPDIFGKLVPMEAHQASSLYSEEKAKLLRRISSQIQEKNDELDTYLASMQLESLAVDENLDALPQELVECCADLNSRNAFKELTDIMSNISNIYLDIEAKIKGLLSQIKEEEEKEKEFVVMMGSKRAPNQILNELKREGIKYKEAHEAAQSNNQALHSAIIQHKDNIILLSQPLTQLVDSLPSVAGVESEDDRLTRMEVQRLLNKVSEMQMQRKEFEAQLRQNIHEDDVTKQLVTNQDDMDHFFQEQLGKHNNIVSLLEQNMSAQINIMQALSETNAAYGATRRMIKKVKLQQSEIISSLIGSYNIFISITHKAQDATEFYSKLESQVNKLQTRIKSLCKVQDEEREEKLAANMKKLGGTGLTFGSSNSKKREPLSSHETTASGPRLKDFLYPVGGVKSMGGTLGDETNPPVLPVDYGGPGLGGTGQPAGYVTPAYNSSLYRPTAVGLESCEGKAASSVASYGQPTAGPVNYPPSAPSPALHAYPINSLYSSVAYTASQSIAVPQPPKTSIASSGVTVPSLQHSSVAAARNMSIYQSFPAQTPYSTYSHNQPTLAHSVISASGVSSSTGSGNTMQFTSNIQNSFSHSIPSQTSYSLSQPYPYQYNTAQDQPPPLSTVSSNAPFQTSISYSAAHNQHYNSTNTSCAVLTTASSESNIPVSYVSQAGVYGTNVSSSVYEYPYSQVSSSKPFPNNSVKTTVAGYSYSTQNQGKTVPLDSSQTAEYSSSSVSSWMPSATLYGPHINYSSALQYSPGYFPTNLTSTTDSQSYSVNSTGSTYDKINPNPGSSVLPVYNQTQFSNPSVYNYNCTTAGAAYGGSQPSSVGDAVHYSQRSYVNSSQDQQSEAYRTQPSAANQVSTSISSGSAGYSQVSVGAVYGNIQGPNGSPSHSFKSQAYDGYPSASTTAATPYSQSQQGSHSHMSYNAYSSQCVAGQHFQGHQYPQYSVAPSCPSQPVGGQNKVSAVNLSTTKPSGAAGLSNLDLLSGIDLAVSSSSQWSPLTPQLVNSSSSNSSPTHVPSMTASPGPDLTAPTTDQEQKNLPEELINNEVATVMSNSGIAKDSSSAILDLAQLAKQAKRSTSVFDPLSNDDTLNQLATDTERFSKFVQGLDKKSLNGPTNLELKWKELTDILETKCSSRNVSVGRCYPLCNRFPDNLPFDVNRVQLPSSRDDYINASYAQLKSFEESIPMILTQAPMPNTCNDFWTMVWETQVEIIVCLNTEAEVKGQTYYPKDMSENLDFGHFSVSVKQIRSAHSDCWIQRTFQFYHSVLKASRVLLHLQFLTWPPSAMPASPGPLLQFVNEVHNLQKQQRNKLKPVVVHCVSGTGRSGVFAVLSTYEKYLHASGSLADIWNLVIELNQQRRSGIPDKSYLHFLYSSALYHAQEVLMKRGILTDKATFEEGPREKTHVRHPSADLLSSDLNRIKAKLGFDNETPSSDNLSRRGSQSSVVSGSSAEAAPTAGTVSQSGTPPPALVSGPSPSPTHSMKSERKPAKIGLTTLPPNLAQSLDPDMLVLTTPNPAKPKKITKESFLAPSGFGQKDCDEQDPFSVLDPMWNLKKS